MDSEFNVLEPQWFLDSFSAAPPKDFVVGSKNGICYFQVFFDLLTTLDAKVKKWVRFMAPILPKPKTIFVGRTNTEYACLPVGLAPEGFVKSALELLDSTRASAIIFKDLPTDSPLLTAESNSKSAALTEQLRASGFEIVSGEALAFVPIQFASIKEFLSKFGGNRRRKIQSNIRAGDGVEIKEIHLVADPISDEVFERVLHLYHQVYENSDLHFDELTREFFELILRRPGNEAYLFLYSMDGQILSFTYNLVYQGRFINKYIGFDYARSRELSLYYATWFHMIDYCIRYKLTSMVAGWTSPEIKAYLGADFTFTQHAVYFRSPFLRWLLRTFKRFFEADQAVLKRMEK
jgi:hypothetical protein